MNLEETFKDHHENIFIMLVEILLVIFYQNCYDVTDTHIYLLNDVTLERTPTVACACNFFPFLYPKLVFRL